MALGFVYLAASSGIIGNGRSSANFARGRNRKNAGFRVVVLQHMLFAHVTRGENRDERGGRGSLFYIRASIGFFALDQTHHANDIESELACRFDRLDGGGPGRADVVDDDDAGTLLAKALDALSGAVLLLSLANQKSIQLTADYGHGDDDGISAHGKPADRLRLPASLADLFQEDFSGKVRTFGVEGGGAAIDVIVAGAAGRELELSQPERFMSQRG